MTRSFTEFFWSIQLLLRPPFVNLMPFHYVALSTRLRLTVFIGISGKPNVFTVSKMRGVKDRLKGVIDNVAGIGFPFPRPAFETFLTQGVARSRYYFGGRTWEWSKDGTILNAYNDMDFYLSRDEAKALSEAIFDSAPHEQAGAGHPRAPDLPQHRDPTRG